MAYFKEKFGKNVFTPPNEDENSESDESDSFYGDFEEGENAEMGPAEAQEINELMRAMDAELRGTNVGQSFADMDPDDIESENLNLIRSFLESYHAQGGDAGPVSNLMNLLLQAEKGKSRKGDL